MGCFFTVWLPSIFHGTKPNAAEFERTKNHTVQLSFQVRTEFSQMKSFHEEIESSFPTIFGTWLQSALLSLMVYDPFPGSNR